MHMQLHLHGEAMDDEETVEDPELLLQVRVQEARARLLHRIHVSAPLCHLLASIASSLGGTVCSICVMLMTPSYQLADLLQSAGDGAAARGAVSFRARHGAHTATGQQAAAR